MKRVRVNNCIIIVVKLPSNGLYSSNIHHNTDSKIPFTMSDDSLQFDRIMLFLFSCRRLMVRFKIV